MSRFTVTVESDRADTGTMVIHLDTSTGTPRVLEITMAAATGGSLSAHSFSQLALDRLVSAFSVDAVPVSTPDRTPVAGPAAPVETPALSATPAGTAVAPETAPATAEPVPAAAKATRVRATKTAPAKARRSAKPAAPSDDTGRVYRRMPDAAELAGAYHEATSVTELAAQYGVPRHTMNGWLGRLRRQGVITARKG
jgi:hypothetical protein